MRNPFARSSGRLRAALSLSAALLGSLSVLSPRLALAQPPGNPPGAPPPPPPPPPPEVGAPTQPPTTTPAKPGDQPPPPPEAGTPTPGGQTGGQGGGGRYLLLPDISLVGIFRGHLSNDKRDMNRERLRLDQAEVAIQSFVYPDVKLDTFITFDGEGGVSVEEAYLSYLKASFLKQTFSAIIGRRKVPFGRVNQLHPHSWLYAVQPYVLTNLVAEESLTGDGGYISYLFPTNKLFAQLDLGFWSQSEKTEDIALPPDPTTQIITSPGAGFADKFGTARLWLAKETLGGTLEAGGSVAGGRGMTYPLNEEANVHPDILISGADLTYRRAGNGTKRLLLRAEYVNHRQKDGDFKKTTDGWYALADQRLDPLTSVGLRYDESGFPYAPGRERGLSLIGTKQLTEQTLYRLQLIHGSRPGKRNFDEIHFELVFGVGPHTHNLE